MASEEVECPPPKPELDSMMNRPRVPNDPYTFMSATQISNIKTNPSSFFAPPVNHDGPSVYGPPREGGRYYIDRYCHVRSDNHFRGLDHSADLCYVGDQIRNDVPPEYQGCQGRAWVRWGPQKTGERTRSHFFGENVERYTNIDMYRRPATNYTGRVVMDYGRPGDGYYAQRYPDRKTWFDSTVPLNCKNVLQSVYRKTWAEHQEVADTEKFARIFRKKQNSWPEYSEYTDRYLLRHPGPRNKTQLEMNQIHASLGQRIQAKEQALGEREEARKERECCLPNLSHISRDTVVMPC